MPIIFDTSMLEAGGGSDAITRTVRDITAESRRNSSGTSILRDIARAKELALDDHGVYTLRTMYARDHETLKNLLPPSHNDEDAATPGQVAQSDDFWVAVCTKSLHSRRFVQFALDQLPGVAHEALAGTVERRLREIACSKEGCIAAQRILDGAPSGSLLSVFETAMSLFVELATDKHGHFVATYLHGRVKPVGDQGRLSRLQDPVTVERVVCDRYGSACVEAFINHAPDAVCQAIGHAIEAMPDATLVRMAADPSGNYVLQALLSKSSRTLSDTLLRRLEPHASKLSYLAKALKQRPCDTTTTTTTTTSRVPSAAAALQPGSPVPTGSRVDTTPKTTTTESAAVAGALGASSIDIPSSNTTGERESSDSSSGGRQIRGSHDRIANRGLHANNTTPEDRQPVIAATATETLSNPMSQAHASFAPGRSHATCAPQHHQHHQHHQHQQHHHHHYPSTPNGQQQPYLPQHHFPHHHQHHNHAHPAYSMPTTTFPTSHHPHHYLHALPHPGVPPPQWSPPSHADATSSAVNHGAHATAYGSLPPGTLPPSTSHSAAGALHWAPPQHPLYPQSYLGQHSTPPIATPIPPPWTNPPAHTASSAPWVHHQHNNPPPLMPPPVHYTMGVAPRPSG